jgi:hypothetical protein
MTGRWEEAIARNYQQPIALGGRLISASEDLFHLQSTAM